MKEKPFLRLHPLRSAIAWLCTQEERRHAYDVNIEQALLSYQSSSEMRLSYGFYTHVSSLDTQKFTCTHRILLQCKWHNHNATHNHGLVHIFISQQGFLKAKTTTCLTYGTLKSDPQTAEFNLPTQ